MGDEESNEDHGSGPDERPTRRRVVALGALAAAAVVALLAVLALDGDGDATPTTTTTSPTTVGAGDETGATSPSTAPAGSSDPAPEDTEAPPDTGDGGGTTTLGTGPVDDDERCSGGDPQACYDLGAAGEPLPPGLPEGDLYAEAPDDFVSEECSVVGIPEACYEAGVRGLDPPS